jgi:predicted glutamine amidotransferase
MKLKKVLHNWKDNTKIQRAYDIKSRQIYIEGKTIINHARYVSVGIVSSLFVYNWTYLKVVVL